MDRNSAELESRSEPHVAIVGGGVIGVCSAYYLARRGARVTLLERGDVGRGASFGNAGLISPGHPPINRPGRVRQALASMASPLSPLYIAPRLDPELWAWLWDFRRYCSAGHLERSMATLAALGRETGTLFGQLIEEESIECGFRRAGYLEVFNTDSGLAAGREEAELVARHGVETLELTGPELREREPTLAPSVRGGWYHPEGSILDPYLFVLEMAQRARLHGAEIRTQTDVTRVLTAGGRVRGVETVPGEILRAEAVILATGAYSRNLVRALGLPLPLQPAKGYHADRDPHAAGTPDLRTPCLLGERAVFCSPIGRRVRFAGTLEFSGENHDIRRPRLRQLTRAAALYLDGVAEAGAVSEWCGLRPCLPDGLPAIGRIPGTAGAFVAAGHAMLGMTLGPVTGKLVAELVLDGSPSIDLTALRPARFIGR